MTTDLGLLRLGKLLRQRMIREPELLQKLVDHLEAIQTNRFQMADDSSRPKALCSQDQATGLAACLLLSELKG